MKFITPLVLLTLALLASCAPNKALYNWTGFDSAVYSFTDNPNEKTEADLLLICEKLIAKPNGTRQVPPPGLCADCGYVLIKAGKKESGIILMKKETELYPESKPFVDKLLKRLEP